MIKQRNNISENEIQASIVDYCKTIGIYNFILHIPNQQIFFSTCANKNFAWAYWNKLKSIGFKKGISDLFLAVPSKGKHGLWIEVKKKNGRPTDHQINFINNMKEKQYEAKIVYSLEEGIKLINKYLSI